MSARLLLQTARGVQRRGDPAVAPAFARIRYVRLQQDARLRQQSASAAKYFSDAFTPTPRAMTIMT
jgi:hypothetical protein